MLLRRAACPSVTRCEHCSVRTSRAFLVSRCSGNSRNGWDESIAPYAAKRLPGQAETILNPSESAEALIGRVPVSQATQSYSDLDYLAASIISSNSIVLKVT